MNLGATHQAIFDRLNGYAALTAVVTGIYSDVPQAADSGDGSVFPFVTFNVPAVSDGSDKSADGTSNVVQVHLWSRTKSAIGRRAQSDLIYDALHKYDLTVTGGNAYVCLFEGMAEFDDPDGRTKHAVLSFRVNVDDI